LRGFLALRAERLKIQPETAPTLAPPRPVGLVSCSITEPGQRCVTMSGSIFMSRTDVNEMNVRRIDLGDELPQSIEPCFS
jgi:hypothetical protein